MWNGLLKYGVMASISLIISVYTALSKPPMVWQFDISTSSQPANTQPYFETVLNYSYDTGDAHAPAILLESKGFSLVWFQGTREAAADVVIMQSRVSQVADDWHAGEPQSFLNSSTLQAATAPSQRIVTLGNTIQNNNRLLITIVSVGGWASAAIADVHVENGVPVFVRKLSLSPLLNRSYLVKAPTLTFADGDIALPAYFELGNAYGELVRIGPDGRVRDKRRITQGRLGIQPVIVAMDSRNAIALLRDFSGTEHLVASWTTDGGQTWGVAESLDIPNPNAPVAALRLSGGNILMAFNDNSTRSDVLRLAISNDNGHNWRRIATLEDHGGDKGQHVRYPMLRRLTNGQIVLVYSHSSKGGIRAHVFNDAWVMAQ